MVFLPVTELTMYHSSLKFKVAAFGSGQALFNLKETGSLPVFLDRSQCRVTDVLMK